MLDNTSSLPCLSLNSTHIFRVLFDGAHDAHVFARLQCCALLRDKFGLILIQPRNGLDGACAVLNHVAVVHALRDDRSREKRSAHGNARSLLDTRNDEGTGAARYLSLQIGDLADDCDLFGLAVINHKFVVIALGL